MDECVKFGDERDPRNKKVSSCGHDSYALVIELLIKFQLTTSNLSIGEHRKDLQLESEKVKRRRDVRGS